MRPPNALAKLQASQIKANAQHSQSLNRLSASAFVRRQGASGSRRGTARAPRTPLPRAHAYRWFQCCAAVYVLPLSEVERDTGTRLGLALRLEVPHRSEDPLGDSSLCRP